MNIILILCQWLIAMVRAICWFDSTAQAPIRHVLECDLIQGFIGLSYRWFN